MNAFRYMLLSVIFATVVGCATWTTTGREFDIGNISKIKNGVTTSADLVSLLGQPLDKSVLSSDEVIWEYSWKKTTSQTTQGADGSVVTSQGDKKTLELLIKHGVVEKFLYNDDPFWIEKLKGSQ